ncbi:TetR/AcrR family transcriptional regulator [Vibrio maerlii]|uniref:TetR/AcrR family transcriptional regulator n=1 Tax=Vibrio maerlii TaxID=2231648 RepID=UPI000E3BCB55|nr:TetR/AcrR family transcriptional regulator [Vibrio maerlii]
MSKKRQLLVDTALDLFYHQGVNNIGINEILKVSGVAKRTLYSHFESKDALLLAALEQRHNNFIDWLAKELKGADSQQQVIDQVFGGLEKWFTNQAEQLGRFRGCFFINTSAEFSDIESDVVKYCRFHKAEVKALISRHLLSKNHNLLDAICIMKEGAITTAYMTGQGVEVSRKSAEILKSIQ